MADKYYTLTEKAVDKLCGLIRESHSVSEGINDNSVATNSTFSSKKIKELLGEVDGTEIEERVEKNETDISSLKESTLMKNQGTENVGKILSVGEDGNIVLVDMPSGDGDVVGYIDENNNIIIMGALPNGNYTMKYEYEDGTYSDSISVVVGNIPEPVEPTNFANSSSSDWLTDYRLSANGTELATKELTGAICTNFVTDIQAGDIVRVEGINFTDANNRQALVKEDGTIITVVKATELSGFSSHITNVTYDSNTLQFTVDNTIQLKKLRFSGMSTGTASDVIIVIKRNGKWL